MCEGKESVSQINKRETASVSASEFRLCCFFRPKNTQGQRGTGYRVFILTGILDLDGGVGLGVGFVDHLSADLLGQNLHTRHNKITHQ